MITAVFDCMIFLQAAANRKGAAGACLTLADEDHVQLFCCPAILDTGMAGAAALKELEVLNLTATNLTDTALNEMGVTGFARSQFVVRNLVVLLCKRG